MDIYQPYTYLIKFNLTGQVYYGVRYAKGCCPGDLFTSYFTSSKEVANLIAEHGVDKFSTQIRRIFSNATDARKWESKVLSRIHAAQSKIFINKCNGSAPANDEEIRNLIIKTVMLKYGVDNPSKHPDVISKIINYWNSLSDQEKLKINATRVDTCMLKYGVKNVMQVDSIKNKAKNSNLEKYGVNYLGEKIVTCPWCNKSGGKMGFDVFHFNYCKMNPNRIHREKTLYTCNYCGISSYNKSNMDRYHFNNCKLSDNYIPKIIIQKTCPHCNTTGSGGNMTRYHFDNCKNKKGT